MLTLAIAGLVVALVATNDQPEAFPAPWEVAERGLSEDELAAGELDPERRRFAIRIDPGHCWDEARSPVRGVEVDEQRRRVVVTALTERAINELDCLSVHPARVTLDEPLGDRRLVVGGNDPTPAEIPMRPPRQDADRKEDGS